MKACMTIYIWQILFKVSKTKPNKNWIPYLRLKPTFFFVLFKKAVDSSTRTEIQKVLKHTTKISIFIQ